MEETKRNWSTHDFYYDLPKELIAQTPLEPRDSSRLLVLHKETGEMEHRHFYDVIDYLNPGDCLVLNDSRVLRHGFMGSKMGQRKVEFLLLTHREGDTWGRETPPGPESAQSRARILHSATASYARTYWTSWRAATGL